MNYSNVVAVTNECEKRCTALDKNRRTPPEDWTRLYLLAYLLTADPTKAEQCIVTGLELSAEDNAAFRDWAHSWARRIVIHNALRLIALHIETENREKDFERSR
jgi:hypothetical protein